MQVTSIRKVARATLLSVFMMGSAMAWAVKVTVAFRERPELKPYSYTVVEFRDNH